MSDCKDRAVVRWRLEWIGLPVFFFLIFSAITFGGCGESAGAEALRLTDQKVAGNKLAGYELVWSDEFNGADGSAPDKTKWEVEEGADKWGNNELEYYTSRPENMQVNGGNLVITARKEEFGTGEAKKNYTSGRLKTQGHFSQAYGRFESRFKIPAGQGMWPAFWMLGDDIGTAGWPGCGEIDIMENIGKEPGTVHASLHGPGTKRPTTDFTAPFNLPAGKTFADDFHIYAVEWEPETIRFYVDDNLYSTFHRREWPEGQKWVFDHPHFLILNLAVGGDWPGSPDETTKFPKQMLVDYVRVYKKQ
jgi:beta-glucanase (GH16 family)